MGRNCFVPNCSGAKVEKVIVFKAPSDAKRLAAWDAAIGRKDRLLTPKDGVCIRHFAEDMIIRRRYFAALGSETLLDVPKRSALSSDAVPCIFMPPASSVPKQRRCRATGSPPPETSKEAGAVEEAVMQQECPGMLVIKEEPREPLDECPEVAIIKEEETEPFGPADQDPPHSGYVPLLQGQQQEPEQCCLGILSELAVKREETDASGVAEQEQCLGIPSVPGELNELQCNSACERTAQAAFQEPNASIDTGAVTETAAEKAQVALAGKDSRPCPDFLDPSVVNLPDAAWNYHRLLKNGLHCFCFVQVSLTPSGSPFSSKVLMVQQVEGGTFSLSTFALDRKVSSAWLPSPCHLRCPNDWSVVNTALGKLHELKLCAGGPRSEKHVDVQLQCGYIDITGVWRHYRCPFLLEERTRCSHCWQLNNMLRIYKAKKDKRYCTGYASVQSKNGTLTC